MKFEEVDVVDIPLDLDDTAGGFIQKFKNSGLQRARIKLSDVKYSTPINFVNAVRVYITYHGVKVKIKKKGEWLYIEWADGSAR